jgi:hypothetical protein
MNEANLEEILSEVAAALIIMVAVESKFCQIALGVAVTIAQH